MIDLSKYELQVAYGCDYKNAYLCIWECSNGLVALGCAPRRIKWGKHPNTCAGIMWYYLPIMAFKSDEEMRELAQTLADMANLKKGNL